MEGRTAAPPTYKPWTLAVAARSGAAHPPRNTLRTLHTLQRLIRTWAETQPAISNHLGRGGWDTTSWHSCAPKIWSSAHAPRLSSTSSLSRRATGGLITIWKCDSSIRPVPSRRFPVIKFLPQIMGSFGPEIALRTQPGCLEQPLFSPLPPTEPGIPGDPVPRNPEIRTSAR